MKKRMLLQVSIFIIFVLCLSGCTNNKYIDSAYRLSYDDDYTLTLYKNGKCNYKIATTSNYRNCHKYYGRCVIEERIVADDAENCSYEIENDELILKYTNESYDKTRRGQFSEDYSKLDFDGTTYLKIPDDLKNFNEKVDKFDETWVLFYMQSSCEIEDCKNLDEIAKIPGYIKLDVENDDCINIVNKYKLSAFPTLLVFKKGLLVDQIEFNEQIKEYMMNNSAQ